MFKLPLSMLPLSMLPLSPARVSMKPKKIHPRSHHHPPLTFFLLRFLTKIQAFHFQTVDSRDAPMTVARRRDACMSMSWVDQASEYDDNHNDLFPLFPPTHLYCIISPFLPPRNSPSRVIVFGVHCHQAPNFRPAYTFALDFSY